MSKIVILSDIHGNFEALKAVIRDLKEIFKVKDQGPDGYILLGDLIDYGPHSNEVVKLFDEEFAPLLGSVWGNHEQAVMTGDYSRFSTDRGRVSAAYTAELLSEETRSYIRDKMDNSGRMELMVGGKRILAVHGGFKDPCWKSIFPDSDLKDPDLAYLGQYDYVLSGHSHLPHFFEHYYKIDDLELRNRKKTVFINPGSVGQPRNHCPLAQYAILDLPGGEILFRRTEYDITKEMSCFSNMIDPFYRDRLLRGV